MNNTPVVICRNVKKTFAGVEEPILSDVTLSVQQGETVAITGSSGSGKTTLLHLLGGLDSDYQGDITINGRSWRQMNAVDAALWRNQTLGFIFQFHLLLPEFSALENTAMPLFIRRIPRRQAFEIAYEKLCQLGLKGHEKKTPDKLSGGERQRVAVARALAGNPKCVLADEPTGNLDRKNAEIVFDLMLESAAQQNAAVIIVSHDERLTIRAQRHMPLIDGCIKEVI